MMRKGFFHIVLGLIALFLSIGFPQESFARCARGYHPERGVCVRNGYFYCTRRIACKVGTRCVRGRCLPKGASLCPGRAGRKGAYCEAPYRCAIDRHLKKARCFTKIGLRINRYGDDARKIGKIYRAQAAAVKSIDGMRQFLKLHRSLSGSCEARYAAVLRWFPNAYLVKKRCTRKGWVITRFLGPYLSPHGCMAIAPDARLAILFHNGAQRMDFLNFPARKPLFPQGKRGRLLVRLDGKTLTDKPDAEVNTLGDGPLWYSSAFEADDDVLRQLAKGKELAVIVAGELQGKIDLAGAADAVRRCRKLASGDEGDAGLSASDKKELANFWYDAKDFRLALAFYEQIRDELPEKDFPQFRYAYALAQTGRKKDALKEYEKVQGNERHGALNNQGAILEQLGRLDEAERHYRESWKLGNLRALRNLAALSFTRARRVAKESRGEEGRRRFFALVEKARRLAKKVLQQQARDEDDELDKRIAKSLLDKLTPMRLALRFIREGEAERAVAWLLDDIASGKNAVADLLAIGRELQDRKRHELAVSVLRRAARLKKDDRDIWFYLAYNLGELGRHEESIRAYGKSIALKPTANAYNNRGIQYRKLGKLKEAIADLRKSVELSPQNGVHLNNLAETLVRAGKDDEAFAVYRKLAALEKAENPLVKKAKAVLLARPWALQACLRKNTPEKCEERVREKIREITAARPLWRYRIGALLAEGDGGVWIERVLPGTPAQRAGLREKDVVTGIDGVPVKEAKDLIRMVSGSKGEPLTFEIMRDGKKRRLSIAPTIQRGPYAITLSEEDAWRVAMLMRDLAILQMRRGNKRKALQNLRTAAILSFPMAKKTKIGFINGFAPPVYAVGHFTIRMELIRLLLAQDHLPEAERYVGTYLSEDGSQIYGFEAMQDILRRGGFDLLLERQYREHPAASLIAGLLRFASVDKNARLDETRRKSLIEARNDLASWLRKRPRSLAGRYYLGKTLLALGEKEKARALLAKAPLQDADGSPWLARLAHVREEAGDLPGAIAALQAYLAHRPKDAQEWKYLARLQHKAKRFEEALRSIDRAIALYREGARPNEIEALLLDLGYGSVLNPVHVRHWRVRILADMGRREEALRALDELMKESAENRLTRLKLLLFKGELLARWNRKDEARETWQRILAEADAGNVPPPPEVQKIRKRARRDIAMLEPKGRAEVFLKEGKSEKALAAIDEHLKDHPEDASALKLKGEALLALQRYAEAAKVFDHYTLLKPNDAEGWFKLAVAQNATGATKEAELNLTRALALKPGKALTWRILLVRGKARMKNDPKKALADFEGAHAIAPEEYEADYQAALALIALGLVDDARERLRDLVRRARPLVDSKRAAAVYLKRARRKLEELSPAGQIRALLKEKKYNQALQAVNALLQKQPGKVSLLALRGRVHEAMGHFDAAREDFIKITLLEPANAASWDALASFYARRGDWQRAARNMSRAVALKPDDASYRNARAWYRFRAGKAKEALPDIERALRAEPGNPYYLNTRAHIRAALGEHDGALKDYAAAVQQGARSAATFLGLARELERKGDKEKALVFYRKAAAVKSDDPEERAAIAAAREALGRIRKGDAATSGTARRKEPAASQRPSPVAPAKP